MISALDFVHLPYTNDLTQAGIQYACRAFPTPDDYLGKPLLGRLQRLIARKAAELSFRRHLTTLELPFENLPGAPLIDPMQYDVALGRRRCILRSILISQAGQIHRLQQKPDLLLAAAASLPAEQLFGDYHSDLDIFIFACVLALAMPGYEALRQAQAAEQPVYLFHPMPGGWIQPAIWAPLEPLTLQLEHATELEVELGGLDHQHSFTTEHLRLAGNATIRSNQGFYTLFYLHAPGVPAGRLGLHSQRLGHTHWVQPMEWSNLWITGGQIILAGWISRRNFRLHSVPPGRSSRSFLLPHTSVPHRWLPIAQLQPMQELFEAARTWASGSH